MAGEERGAEEFPDYRTTCVYALQDHSLSRVSNAFRGIAWDVGDSKYLVHGAQTRIEVSDDEKKGGLILKVMTFLEQPELFVQNTLRRLGAELVSTQRPPTQPVD
jgi:hypothetical protein